MQSPIDLPSQAMRAAEPRPAPPSWSPVAVRVVNDGHTIRVDDEAPSSFVFEGTEYRLDGFHFHSPSDHTIDGRGFDAELHLVHRAASGKVLVVSILFRRGRDNELLAPVWDAMPTHVRTEPSTNGATIDLRGLLPASPKYLRYDGSFTAPPCSEGVIWLVVVPDADAPPQLSDAQIGRLRAALHGPSNRPIQPRNDRVVVRIE
jgi:carbonic anhydrase